MDRPLVSIICNAYNQEEYIRDALEGFVKQEADFPFEVLIHDDASTDRTPEIIHEYELQYPELIKPIYQKQNQYSQHIPITTTYQLPRVHGEFVAFCEGDDYWTDPHKLQKQINAFKVHPEADICGHRARKVNNDGFVGFTAPRNHDAMIPIEEIIMHGGGHHVATASLMMRASVVTAQTPMLSIISLDYVWQLQGALRGGMIYLNEEMSVYRVMSQGSWSSRMKKDPDTRNAHSDRVVSMLRAFNEYSQKKYETEVNNTIQRIKYRQLLRSGDYRSILTKEYRDVFLKQSLKHKIYIYLKAIMQKGNDTNV